MCQSIIFWCYIIATLNSGLISSDTTRVKRVIHGKPVLTFKNSDYRVLEYFVWIGNGHNCDLPAPDFLKEALELPINWEIGGIRSYPYWGVGRICEPKPHNLQCTGSLLTQFLVQTACHCVANFNGREEENGEEYPVLMKPEEVGFTVHPAKRLISEYKVNEGVYSRNFVIHPKCMKKRGAIFHDYGLIVLYSSFREFQHSYAPIYPAAELARMWLDVQATGKACLIIGFGAYSWISNDRHHSDNNALKSDVLRHGWTLAMTYGECHYKFYVYIGSMNYKNQSTFVCTVNLVLPSREVVVSGKGDSGGPVTCDNEYIGIVSEKLYGTVGPRRRNRLVGYGKHMSTAFSVYENAAEYRAQLVYRIFEMYGANDPKRDFIVTQPPLKMFYLGETPTSRARSLQCFCFLAPLLIVMNIFVCFK